MFRRLIRFLFNLDAEYLKAYRDGYFDGSNNEKYNPRILDKRKDGKCLKK